MHDGLFLMKKTEQDNLTEGRAHTYNLGRLMQIDHLSPRIQNQSGQHSISQKGEEKNIYGPRKSV